MAIFNSYVKLPEGNVSLLGGIPHVCPRFGHICLSGLPLSCCQGDGDMTGGNTDPFTSYDLGILRVPITYIYIIYIYQGLDPESFTVNV